MNSPGAAARSRAFQAGPTLAPLAVQMTPLKGPHKIAVIANRTAGKGTALRAVHQAKRSLWGWDTQFIFPSSVEELRAICGELDPKHYRALVVIGGDGTINQALRGAIHSQVPLCAFPGGTANDLACELGIRGDWEQVQRLIDTNSTDRIDLIEVNRVPFATVAGVGIGSLLAAEFNEKRARSRLFRELSRRLQSQSYLFMSAKTILFGSGYTHQLQIKADSFDERLSVSALFICNQSWLGGNLRVAPSITNNDSRFNVLIVPKSGTYRLIRGLGELKNGKLPSDFISFSTSRLLLRDLKGKPIRVFGDGEILTAHPELDFRLIPEAISVFRDRQTAATGEVTARTAGGKLAHVLKEKRS